MGRTIGKGKNIVGTGKREEGEGTKGRVEEFCGKNPIMVGENCKLSLAINLGIHFSSTAGGGGWVGGKMGWGNSQARKYRFRFPPRLLSPQLSTTHCHPTVWLSPSVRFGFFIYLVTSRLSSSIRAGSPQKLLSSTRLSSSIRAGSPH